MGGRKQNLCVDDTGPGPTLTLFVLAGFKPVFYIPEIFKFFQATFNPLSFFKQGDYRVVLQLN